MVLIPVEKFVDTESGEDLMSDLLAATSWIDVSIPFFGGLLMLFCPNWAMKSTGSPEKDEARKSLARKGGVILLIVAGMYYVTTTHGS